MNKKYQKLVFELPCENNTQIQSLPFGDDRSYIASPQAYFRGSTQVPGSKFNVGFQIFERPFFLDRMPHTHDVDEYLVFLGGTFPNLFDFDAEISLTIGKLGHDDEVFTITEPSVVRIPAGVYHCPINFKKVNKPLFFQAMLMQDMFSLIYDTDDGGRKELWYNGPLPCKLRQGEECNSCRECVEEDWQ
jgi:mannose-6-phosphate isomerase-like protein (cupin superfamily)